MNMSSSVRMPRLRLGSVGIVVLVLGALALWMLSGMLGEDQPADAAAATTPAAGLATGGPSAARPVFTVQAREQTAETVSRVVEANGDTQPDQVVNIASQVEGQVIEVGPRKGARVAAGALLARIDPRDNEAMRVGAEATVRQRELEYAAAQKLRETGYVTDGELAAKLAALESARATLQGIELRMIGLTINAPVEGVLEERMVEKGDYVKIGEPVARLIKLDPLIVSGGVSENDIPKIRTGAPAEAEILGRRLKGKVRFVASMADERTRTFTVEIAVANPDNRTPAGVSARLILPVDEVLAQRIPTSLLSLADDGAIGVKHVVDGKVVFTPASIIRADGDAVYVDGLPEKIMLITRGQGFATAGQPVNVKLEGAAASAPAGVVEAGAGS
jgi:membrane fusion protein, multidrug efflux system